MNQGSVYLHLYELVQIEVDLHRSYGYCLALQFGISLGLEIYRCLNLLFLYTLFYQEFPELFLSSDGTHDGALDLEEAFGRLGIEAHLSSDDDSDDSDDGDASDGEDDSDDGDSSIDAILAEAVQRLRS